LPHIIVDLLRRDLHTYLAPHGHMILAGIIEEREPDLRLTLASHNLTVVNRLNEGDWVSLVVCHHP
jgi:ribosomal protein L11 methylase PrmA